MKKRGQDLEPVSMLFFLIIALMLCAAFINLSDKYGKDSSTKMSFYTIDNAFLINTMLIPPGGIVANYSLDLSRYKFNIEDGFLVVKNRKHSDVKYPLALDSNVKISLNPSETNYYSKKGDITLSETKISKPKGLTCPVVNTIKKDYKILFDPQDDFSYVIYNALKSSNSYLVSSKDKTKTTLERLEVIKNLDASMYLQISYIESNEKDVIAYVPFDNLNSTKFSCMLVNSLGQLTDTILVVHTNVYPEFNFVKDAVILKIYGDIDSYKTQKNIQKSIEGYFS